MPTSSSPLLGIVPLVAALALLAVSLLLHRGGRTKSSEGEPSPARRIGRGTLAWACVFAALLALMAGLSFGGLFGADAATMAGFTALTLVLAAVVLLRERLADLVRGALGRTKLPTWTRQALCVGVVLLVATAFATLALERPWNPQFLSIAPPYCLVEGGIVGLALLALCLLSQGTGVGPAVGSLALFGIGVAQYYVRLFKNAAILPGDLTALGTAAAVSGGYSYVFSADVVWGLALAEVAVCASALLQPTRTAHRARSVVGHLVGTAASAAALVALVTIPPYQAMFGVVTNSLFWYSMDYYQQQGFLTTFTMVAQTMPIRVPEGYSEEGARSLEASLAQTYDEGTDADDRAAQAQFSSELPSVVVVMNETFSDLSIYQPLAEEIGYEGPTYFRQGLTDALAKDDLTVSVVGGGTCNTEFEFLTGVSLACVGDGKYPYSSYDLSGAPSIVRQFKELGYQTTAMHPNWPSNWKRSKVYPALGFDEFLSYETGTFDEDPWYHNGVSDEATYEHVLETLQQSDQPQFVFDVTMQNHGGYDKDNIPQEDLPGYEASKLDDEQNAALNEYLACINESDRALEEFIDKLRDLDRPVVVVFFGDHQPSISPTIDDAYYSDETDQMAHAQRQRKTCYAIWANYDVAGRDQASEPSTTSVDALGALALSYVGAPLTDYQKAKLTVHESIPAINTVGYLGADGTWYEPEAEGPYAETFRELAQVTYLEFGSKVQ